MISNNVYPLNSNNVKTFTYQSPPPQFAPSYSLIDQLVNDVQRVMQNQQQDLNFWGALQQRERNLYFELEREGYQGRVNFGPILQDLQNNINKRNVYKNSQS